MSLRFNIFLLLLPFLLGHSLVAVEPTSEDLKREFQVLFIVDTNQAGSNPYQSSIELVVITEQGPQALRCRYNAFSKKFLIPTDRPSVDFYSTDADFSDPDRLPSPLFTINVADIQSRALIVLKYENKVGGAIRGFTVPLELEKSPQNSLILYNMSPRKVMIKIGDTLRELKPNGRNLVKLSEVQANQSQPIMLAVQYGDSWEYGFGTARRLPNQGSYLLLFYDRGDASGDYQMKSMKL